MSQNMFDELHNEVVNDLDQTNFEKASNDELEDLLKKYTEKTKVFAKKIDENQSAKDKADKNRASPKIKQWRIISRIFEALSILSGIAAVVFTVEAFKPQSKTLLLIVSIVCFVAMILFVNFYFLYRTKVQIKQDVYYELVFERNELLKCNLLIFLFQSLIGTILDKRMYKAIYLDIYGIQEYLKEEDPKGYKSFERAFKKLNIDFSSYVNKDKMKELFDQDEE